MLEMNHPERTMLAVQVEFLLLGIIKGSVGLRRFFEEVEGDGDTVKVRPIPCLQRL